MKKQVVIIVTLVVFLPGSVTAANSPVVFSLPAPIVLLALCLVLLFGWLCLVLRRLAAEKNAGAVRLRLMEQIVDQASLPILLLHADLTVAEANQCALRTYERSSLRGVKLLDLHPELAGYPAVADMESFNKEKSIAGSASFSPLGGQEAVDQWTLKLITVDGQTHALWYGRQPGRLAASYAATEAEESINRMTTEFIANINHEVRTPMNAIIGYTEMLANSPLGPQEKRFVAIIHKSSLALVSIFNDIMELSKIDSGRVQVMGNTVRLSSIISEIEELFKEVATEKGLHLRCRVAKHLPPSFILDGVRLKQILQNLVSNAVKFTNEGSVILSVDGVPSTEQEGCFHLRFTVEDSGKGISEVERQRIEELFHRQEKTIIRRYGGVGLGLTLCSRLVAMMGGVMELASVEEEGARFTVVLNNVLLAPLTLAEQELNEEIKHGNNLKLLVVDDFDLIKDIFIDYFRDSPYTVFTANTGDEALALAVTEQPDLIFMDLSLAGRGDGRSVTEQLRQMAKTAVIPVVVMTGEMLDEGEYRPLFDALLQKPFQLEMLKCIVHRFARPPAEQSLQPSESTECCDEDDHFRTAELAEAWSPDLELLRRQASRSGSLTDAASLGGAMKDKGIKNRQPMLTELGEELILYVKEPNIMGVDCLLSKLSKVVDRE